MTAAPWLIAHRGANRKAPENTRPAFDWALKYPVDGIETDIQMTKDGVPVLYHDRTLHKIIGKRKRVAQLTFNQLKELDFGKWHDLSFAGEPVLTLNEMLSLFAHRTRLMLEIKSRKPDQVSGSVSALTLKVLEELLKPEFKNCRENFFILSFDPDVLNLAHQQAPEFKYVLNLSENAYDPTGFLSIMETDAVGIEHLYGLCVAVKNLSKNLAAFAHRHRKKIMTYSCNNSRQVKHAIKCGADAILTDRPGWLTSIIHSDF